LGTQPSENMRQKSIIPWIISVILATFIVYGFIPGYGEAGQARILIMVFVAVVFKATIEFFLSKHRKKPDDKQH
jgi:hypothetical protein